MTANVTLCFGPSSGFDEFQCALQSDPRLRVSLKLDIEQRKGAEIVDQRRMIEPECRFVDLQGSRKILLGFDGLVVVLRDPPHVDQCRSYLRAILTKAPRKDLEGFPV